MPVFFIQDAIKFPDLIHAAKPEPDREFPPENGPKLRIRPESFADHYTQARLFFTSQSAPEQDHIVAALIFELSKVETPAIRIRVVSHLLNIDADLARRVAEGLGLAKVTPALAAVEPQAMDASPAPSIVAKASRRWMAALLAS